MIRYTWSIKLVLCAFMVHSYAAAMTQSEAHMSVPVIRKAVNSWYGLGTTPELEKLYNKVVAQERKYNDTHYVFYSAFTNEWRVPQDLFLKLYQRLCRIKFDITDFRAFRWIPATHKTPEELLKKEFFEHGMIDDNKWDVRANLISTNLALFGNVGFPGECTFEYYLNLKSHAKVDAVVFEKLLDIFDPPARYQKGQTPILYKYIDDLQGLGRFLIAEEFRLNVPKIINNKEVLKVVVKKPQTLSQVFIPKDMADKVAYLAWVEGIPYEQEFVNWVLTNTQVSFGRSPAFEGEFGTKLFLENIRELFKDKQAGHPIFQQFLEGIKQGKYKISKFLDKYKATPYLLPNGGNNAQARIVVNPEDVGNPKKNVVVIDYNNISQENKDLYEKELNNIVAKISDDISRKERRKILGNPDICLVGEEAKIDPIIASKNLQDLASALSSLDARKTRRNTGKRKNR